MGVCLSPSLSLPISLLPSTFAQTNRRHNSHFTRTFFLILHFSVQVFVSSLSFSLSLSFRLLTSTVPHLLCSLLTFYFTLSLSHVHNGAHTKRSTLRSSRRRRSWCGGRNQCDKIGRFLKVFGDIFFH